jgi:hypothetical protein
MLGEGWSSRRGCAPRHGCSVREARKEAFGSPKVLISTLQESFSMPKESADKLGNNASRLRIFQ